MKTYLLIILCLLIVGCDDCIIGSNNVVNEVRLLPGFSSVTLAGSANVYVSQSETPFVRVETHDNLMEVVTTTVTGDTLYIRTDGCYTGKVDVYIAMPEIESLSIEGSGKIVGGTPFVADEIKFRISGSGSIQGELQSTIVTTEISGSGKIYLQGKTTTLDHKVSGSGDLNAFNMAADKVTVSVTGSGKSHVVAEETLDVKIDGSGNVIYQGEPKVSYSGSGSGSVRAS